MNPTLITAAIMACALVLGACAEREQVLEAGRSYQGKPDSPAWGQGDRAAWEAGINKRTLAQNEYRRIEDR